MPTGIGTEQAPSIQPDTPPSVEEKPGTPETKSGSNPEIAERVLQSMVEQGQELSTRKDTIAAIQTVIETGSMNG
jgi:hypothetical protein